MAPTQLSISPHFPAMHKYRSILALFVLVGCQHDDPYSDEQEPPPLATLKVLVVDDPPLANAIEQEWQARGGKNLVVEQTTTESLLDKESIAADIVVYPTRLLGELKARNWLAPVPDDVWKHEDYDANDLFETIRRREVRWGKSVAALPFGSPQWMLYIRDDLLEKLDRPPPATWAEYDELAALMAAEGGGNADWSGIAEPWGDSWGGLVLVARASAYAKHSANYSTLFDVASFEPLIDGPPFLRALEELVAVSAYASDDAATLTPADAKTRFAQQQCGMAWGWPTSFAQDEKVTAWPPLRLVELPGSPDMFDFHEQTWGVRPDQINPRIPFIGFSGRLGSVTRETVSSRQAWQTLAWLTGPRAGTSTGSASASTAPFRLSQLDETARWVERELPAEVARDYAATLRTAQSRPTTLRLPPIPGIDNYLAALDRAVSQAISQEQSPQEALREAAGRWREITAEHGIERQRAAYRKSLGLSE